MLKRTIILLALLFVVCTVAQAITPTISAQDVTGWQYGTSQTVTLRIYSNTSFFTQTGERIQAGTPSTAATGFFRSYTCTFPNSTTVRIPTITTLPTTTDAQDNANARYTAVFYQGTTKRDTYLSNFVLSHTLGSPVTWSRIAVFNAAYIPFTDTQTLNRSQISNMIASAVGAQNHASVGVAGVTELSATPIDLNHPIAASDTDTRLAAANTTNRGTVTTTTSSSTVVSTNDPRLTAGTSIEYNVTSYASLAAALSDIGSTEGTLLIPVPTAAAGQTIPANVHLRFINSGQFTGIGTVTIRGNISAPLRRIFASTLTVSLSGNNFISEMYPEWFGGLADNSTNSGSAIQSILDIFAAAGKNPGLILQNGKYVVSGGLQDTSLSNAQIVLPKVNMNQSQLTVSFRGVVPPATPWNNDAGAIIRSTLTSGNGAVIGVKHNQGFGSADANTAAHNMSSNITVHFENVTVRLPVNPTNTGIDLSHTFNPTFDGTVKVDTDDFGAGGLNPNLIGGIIPDVRCTEPTTTTSWGVKMPMDFLPNAAQINGTLMIQCFYNGFRSSELTLGTGAIVIHGGKVGIGVEGSTWPQHLNKVVTAAVARPLKAVGVNPDLSGISGANTNAYIYIDDLQVENDATMPWTSVVSVIDDPSGYLKGDVRVFYGAGAILPRNVADQQLISRRSERPWNTRDPSTNITGLPVGLSLTDAGMAVDETYRGIATSDDSALAWKVVTCKQSGTGKGCGVFTIANDQIADGLDKRLGMIYTTTGTTTNSGLMSFWTMRIGTPGVITQRTVLDDLGNWVNYGFDRFGTETLTISSNTITPTKQIIHVGAGLIKTITVPAMNSFISSSSGGVCIDAIPDAAYTYDATGNIVVPGGGGTATINRLMRFCWEPTASKWFPSY